MSALLDKLAPAEAQASDSFDDIRRRARQQLMQHGFPDLKTEEWKYTPLKVLEKRELDDSGLARGDSPALPFEHVLIDLFRPFEAELPDGVRVEALAPEDLREPDGNGRAEAFAWLNLASFEPAFKLVIESDPGRPVVLAAVTGEGFGGAVHPRVVVEVAAGVSAALVDVQIDAGAGLVNVVQDIYLQTGARLDHALRRTGADSVWVQRSRVALSADSDYRFTALEHGGRLHRQDHRIDLDEPGANGEIDGTVRVNSRQHVDYHTTINHNVGHTNSREAFRILADGSGVGVFNGRIYIHPGADDSHSDLNTGNLLLGDNARINTKPELEIHAEEVTASHGATVGQLDDSALFYLRSRGLSEAQAMALLKYGFAAEPLGNARPESVRDWLRNDLEQAL